MAGGLRFPKTVQIVTKNAAGRSQTVTIDFEKVVLNEPIADTLFRVPLLKAN